MPELLNGRLPTWAKWMLGIFSSLIIAATLVWLAIPGDVKALGVRVDTNAKATERLEAKHETDILRVEGQVNKVDASLQKIQQQQLEQTQILYEIKGKIERNGR